jgi:lysyl-tRNA synthetase class I
VRKEIRVMTKTEIINAIKNVGTTTARNSMGCSENWYNSYYAIKMTFTMEEIESMSEKELNNLVKLADNIEENLY